jgi:hypothetical protein
VKKSLKTRKIQATDEVAKKMQALRVSLKSGARVPNGTFNKIRQQVLASHGLEDEEFTIPYHSIYHRIKNDSLANLKRGPTSPALQIIEPILLIQAKYRQEAGQPLKPSEGIALANSLLERSVIQDRVRDFQKVLGKEPSGEFTDLW